MLQVLTYLNFSPEYELQMFHMEYKQSKCSSKEKINFFIWKNRTRYYLPTRDSYKKKDIKYLTYKALVEEFISIGAKKRNGVVLYINLQLWQPTFVEVEINPYGLNTRVLGIYIPNEEVVMFYKQLMETFLMKVGYI